LGDAGLETRGVTVVGRFCWSKETGESEDVEPVGDMVCDYQVECGRASIDCVLNVCLLSAIADVYKITLIDITKLG
jgi:hypothetical protein